jgi:hypothetical protein
MAGRKHQFTSLVPYFGGKSKIAHLYSEPACKTLVEPFCGAAAYSLRYSEHDVWLNDVNPDVVGMWMFLTSPDALRIVKDRVPFLVKAGQTLRSITRPDDPRGLVTLMRMQSAQIGSGGKGRRTRISPFAAEVGWPRFRQRLEYWIPRVAHWKVTGLDYIDMANIKATWFVDAPYNNAAGRYYANDAKPIDFTRLARWVYSRQGQVIVCENIGADWLPFRRLTREEVVFTRDDGKIGLWDDGGDD